MKKRGSRSSPNFNYLDKHKRKAKHVWVSKFCFHSLWTRQLWCRYRVSTKLAMESLAEITFLWNAIKREIQRISSTEKGNSERFLPTTLYHVYLVKECERTVQYMAAGPCESLNDGLSRVKFKWSDLTVVMSQNSFDSRPITGQLQIWHMTSGTPGG